MKPAAFTVRKIGEYQGKPGTIISKAAGIVSAMEGCPMKDIIAALTSMDHTNSPNSKPNPPRWVTQFAGLESEAANKSMEPWIEIVLDGRSILDKAEFRAAL
jgi:hypothetical protein